MVPPLQLPQGETHSWQSAAPLSKYPELHGQAKAEESHVRKREALHVRQLVADKEQVRQRILHGWHAEAEELRKVPEGQVHEEPMSTVACAGGHAVHDAAVTVQAAQEESHAEQTLPFKKNPVLQRH
jgi:hypothetical protein